MAAERVLGGLLAMPGAAPGPGLGRWELQDPARQRITTSRGRRPHREEEREIPRRPMTLGDTGRDHEHGAARRLDESSDQEGAGRPPQPAGLETGNPLDEGRAQVLERGPPRQKRLRGGYGHD